MSVAGSDAPEVNPAPVSADAVRSRRQLYLIALAFAAPLLIAMLLRGLGWQPIASRNHGNLVEPPFDISAIALTRPDGSAYEWRPLEARFHLLVRQEGDCDTGCARFADMLHRVWAAQGRQAERLDVLWLGDAPPAPTQFRHWVGLQPSTELEAALKEQGVAIDCDTRLRLQPDRHECDGFFAAVLERCMD